MRTSALLLIIVAASLSACNQSASYSNSMPVALETIPKTFENPDGSTPPAPKAQRPEVPAPAPEAKHDAGDVSPAKLADLPDQKHDLERPQASQFIKNADWVMVHEGHFIGTPCNLYLRRVLEYSGFSGHDFLANDFDLYAHKYFRHYKSVDFKNDAEGSEIARLKGYLWSYPERTPFIMQWSRSGMHGHIAIVERIEDHLIIYQANLGKYTARKDQTTVQSLLSGFNRRTLTVYSDFQ